MESPFMDINELATFLGCPVSFIKYNLHRAPHKLPPRFSKPYERCMWHREDVDSWVTKRREESQARALSQRPKAGSIHLTK